jgi:GH15 family glucan-1,4-alpha-glucosidase
LADVGHHEVAQGFRDFIMRSAAGRGDDLRIMYGVYGERRLPEFEVDLTGWRNSKPVRIGNAAAEQTQLDVYGHLLDAAHLWHRRTGGIDDDEWRFLSAVVDEARALRHRPDAGIWELRGDPQHHVHSKVMIWVALDRGIRLVDDHGLTEAHTEIAEWRRARDEIRDEIDSRGVHDGHYVSAYGSKDVDASLLKLALVGYVPADDARMVATVETITRDLADPSGMVRRFRGDGGMQTFGDHTEGVFLLCSFWLVEVLAMQGRHDEARALFERVLTVGNDVGLFAEEADPASGELLGNFPQAFTHLGLISAAMRLASSTDGS